MSADKTAIIREPGKFEGEPVYVRELWDHVLDGMDDETIYDGDTPVSVFELDADMRRDYQLDETDCAVLLWEDSNGFVHSRVMDKITLDAFRDECVCTDSEVFPEDK